MSTWFRQVANNSLSYLNAQIEPLRHRQKYGKTPEEISNEIKSELHTCISREKDVERKIQKQEENRKKIRSQHQELNFRVQNLDENRQFLFKQTTDYEQKLTNQASKQKKLLMAIDKLKTQLYDVEHIKLGSISLNLKGATELKEGTKSKIPKLIANKQGLEERLQATLVLHREITNSIDEVSQKRDSLRKHLQSIQQSQPVIKEVTHEIGHELQLVEVKMADITPQTAGTDDQNQNQNENMYTIFDNTPQSQSQSQTPPSANVDILYHESLQCDQCLEAKHLLLGKVVLDKLNLERDLLRIADMLELQSQTLSSIENSRIEYSLSQQKYLRLKASLSSKHDLLRINLSAVKKEMRKYRDDIQAIVEASHSLSQKKFALANKLKKTIDKQNEIEDGLKILHRNRMSLRSRKSQLLKQQISLLKQTQTMEIKRIVRSEPDSDCDDVIGTLRISNERVVFFAADKGKKLYNINHEIIDVSHSSLLHFDTDTAPLLLLYLFNARYYTFKCVDKSDKTVLLLMHNFMETKRELLDFKKKEISIIKKNNNIFEIEDIEIEDEFYCHCCSGYELRQIILHCPSRIHVFKWKLFYSTAIHGISMNTLYGNCESVEESVLVIKDSSNHVFGAFIDVRWIVSSDYRGSIDCFVFELVQTKSEEEKSEQSQTRKCKVYRSCGDDTNTYIIRSCGDDTTIGAGERPAIYFDYDLNLGRSVDCSTFSSPKLSKDTQFQITTLEIWGIDLR